MKITVKLLLFTLLATAVAVAVTATASARLKVKAARYVEEKDTLLELKVNCGKVYIAFDVSVPAGFMRKNRMCVITPMFVNGSFADELPPIILEGARYEILAREEARFDKKTETAVPHLFDRILYEGKPISTHYQAAVPYNPRYKGATLVLEYRTFDICGRELSSESLLLAHGVTDYADFIKRDPVVYYRPNSVLKAYVGDFNNRSVFRRNSTVIESDMFHANGYDDLLAEMRRLQEEPDVKILAVNIQTSASPEGPLSANRRLAEGRSEVIADLLTRDLDLDRKLITREWTDENWDAFIEVLPTSGLDNIPEIRRIIAEYSDLDRREKELNRLPNNREIHDVFQHLRNCLITIDYDSREYFESETTINGTAYAAVKLGKETPEISLKTTRRHHESAGNIHTANNMMVALMDADRYEEALTYADMIPDKDIDPVIANNKAVLYMYLDNKPLSSTMFKLAGDVPMARYNHGLMLLVNEDYDDAAELLRDYDESTNSVVAHIYTGDYDTAASQTHRNETAEAHYLRAIACARDRRDSLALNSLEQAVKADPAYKQAAMNQAEFIPYRTHERFVEITE